MIMEYLSIYLCVLQSFIIFNVQVKFVPMYVSLLDKIVNGISFLISLSEFAGSKYERSLYIDFVP